RIGHAMVWTGSQILLFGGTDASGVDQNDLFAYDPFASGGKGKWNAVTTTGGPPAARPGHAMVNIGGGRVIVVGGQQGTGAPFPDAWILNGTTWTQATVVGGPVARTEHAMIWDGTRLVLHGGYTGTGVSSETWTGTIATNTVTWSLHTA